MRGAKGNTKAIIACDLIDCPQLRIANLVKEMDKTDIEANEYQYAFVDGETIVLE